MQHSSSRIDLVAPGSAWLKTYYFVRAAVSILWIALAVLVGKTSVPIAAILIILYPVWDAFANFVDARKNGGIKANFSQAFNCAVSLITAACIAYALGIGMKPVLFVFGVWAILAGAFQLVTGVRRWKSYGAQWVMILSGGQSVLVGGHFFKNAVALPPPGIEAIVPYAALGAFYFLLSAIWLTVKDARKRSAHAAG
ncbi:membrane protein [Caballeronia mineralivorans PML1(12)]|uniref:Membrane protein n=1 Tax=Caballeronia mineralivorans PML1(12) TaxID=908627 RepID=A0A0J1G6D9_9BURK|nr:hypothetical protein [Caballeronia mineralivorans]KLU27843.1 membrane protein [Caballeronia mineralivorans PML1(12)]